MKFLFFVERELHFPILKPIWEYIQANHIGNIAVFSFKYRKSKIGNPGYGITRQQYKYLESNNIKYIKNPLLYKPDITFIADHSYQNISNCGFIVNVGHGTISKGYYYTNRDNDYRENIADLICVPGPIHKKQLLKRVYTPIIETHMSKYNTLKCEYSKKSFFNKNHLNDEWKTILIAPTFDETLSILPHLKKPIRSYFPNKTNIILKLHGATPAEHVNQIKSQAISGSQIYISTKDSIVDLFIYSDLLVSDVSSVIYEYLNVQKPILLFNSPTMTKFHNFHPLDIEYRYRNIGECFTRLHQIKKKTTQLLEQPHINLKLRKKYYRMFFATQNDSIDKFIVENVLEHYKLRKTETLIVIQINAKKHLKNVILEQISKQYPILYWNPNKIPIPHYQQSITNQKQLLKTISNLHFKYVFFAHSEWSISTNLVKQLLAHFKINPKNELIYPLLVLNDSDSKIQPRTLNKQLGYSLPGMSMSTHQFIPYAFASLKNKFLELFEIYNLSDIHYPAIYPSTKCRIACDCLIFKNSQLETLNEWNEPLVPNSLFLNLSYLNLSCFPKFLFQKIIQSMKKYQKPWNSTKQAELWIDLASMHEKRHEWKLAMDYINKANTISDLEQNSKNRLNYHYKLTLENL